MARKIFGVLISLVLAVSLVACGADDVKNEEITGGLGVANPMQAYTLEELAADTAVNITLPAEVFADLSVFKYNFEEPLYQIGFKYTDGNNYVFRMQKTEILTDISGMYYSWTNQTADTDKLCEISTNDEGQGICIWFDGEYTYCISMAANASADALGNMYSVIKTAMGK